MYALFAPFTGAVGLGHLMRLRNVAEALRRAHPELFVRFVVANDPIGVLEEFDAQVLDFAGSEKVPPSSPFDGRGWIKYAGKVAYGSRHAARVFRAGGPQNEYRAKRLITRAFGYGHVDYYLEYEMRSRRPRVVVFDHAWHPRLNPIGRALGARMVYMVRETRRESLTGAIGACLETADHLLVPHEEGAFSETLRALYDVPVTSVGTITRLPRPGRVEALRTRHRPSGGGLLTLTLGGGGARPEEVGLSGGGLLTLTLGGGGARPEEVGLTDRFLEIAARLARDFPRWRLIFVTGPYGAAAQTAGPANLEVRRTHSDMPSLMAASDFVVAHGGYNTVSELRSGRIPAIVFPRPTSSERSQAHRAYALAKESGAVVAETEPDVESIARTWMSDGVPEDITRGCSEANTDDLMGAPRAAAAIYELLTGGQAPRTSSSKRARAATKSA